MNKPNFDQLLNELKEIAAIQMNSAHNDSYNLGLANGLILALCILEQKEYPFLKSKKLKDKKI